MSLITYETQKSVEFELKNYDAAYYANLTQMPLTGKISRNIS